MTPVRLRQQPRRWHASSRVTPTTDRVPRKSNPLPKGRSVAPGRRRWGSLSQVFIYEERFRGREATRLSNNVTSCPASPQQPMANVSASREPGRFGFPLPILVLWRCTYLRYRWMTLLHRSSGKGEVDFYKKNPVHPDFCSSS